MLKQFSSNLKIGKTNICNIKIFIALKLSYKIFGTPDILIFGTPDILIFIYLYFLYEINDRCLRKAEYPEKSSKDTMTPCPFFKIPEPCKELKTSFDNCSRKSDQNSKNSIVQFVKFSNFFVKNHQRPNAWGKIQTPENPNAWACTSVPTFIREFSKLKNTLTCTPTIQWCAVEV